VLAQRAVMLQGRCFPNDGRAPAAARGAGGSGLVTAVECINDQPAPARSITKHAHACSVQHMQASLPYSYDIILTASPSLRPEGIALMSITHRTQPNCGHHMQNSASGCVPCHGIPNQVLCNVKSSYARENQTWVYVQSAAAILAHPRSQHHSFLPYVSAGILDCS
jgi:hypothetical protein